MQRDREKRRQRGGIPSNSRQTTSSSWETRKMNKGSWWRSHVVLSVVFEHSLFDSIRVSLHSWSFSTVTVDLTIIFDQTLILSAIFQHAILTMLICVMNHRSASNRRRWRSMRSPPMLGGYRPSRLTWGRSWGRGRMRCTPPPAARLCSPSGMIRHGGKLPPWVSAHQAFHDHQSHLFREFGQLLEQRPC